MKSFNKIKNIAFLTLAMACGMTSCDYLDIVPPEQADLSDANKDREATLGFLYSCYGSIFNPTNYNTVEAGSDEFVAPRLWEEAMQKITWDLNEAASLADGWRWGTYYRFIGQCHLFMQQLPTAHAISDEEKTKMKAEVDFLLAYYHMCVLIQYGPCPITDSYIPQSTPTSEFPGRSHFDYVVEWCSNKFDEACEHLPATRDGDDWGRATTVMARALQARLRVFAASPLWNGEFPFRDWKNESYETPGYGYDLVSMKYEREKWEKALAACKLALQEAEAAGHKLFSLEDSEALRSQENVDLPFVPFHNDFTGPDAEKNAEFCKHVMLMRYLTTTRVNEGNREIIWGIADQGNIIVGSLPHRTIKNNQGTWKGGWSGVNPTLNALARFYTENGKPIDESDLKSPTWYESANVEGRKNIIRFNTKREPRYYAWVAFDDGDMGSQLANGKPLRLELRNSELHGYNPSLFNRDNCETGFLNQKFIQPKFQHTPGGENNVSKPRPLIRMAELYLNLAECYAALDQNNEALQNLNIIRKRAGVPELKSSDIDSEHTCMKWVQNERSNELWMEGHRYYDIRRWMIAPQTMGAGVRIGLDALHLDPSFEQFNTPVEITQNFKWTNRMYVSPIFKNEVYKDPQLVQFPGY